MSGSAGLEERPAYSRTSGKIHFRFSLCLKQSARQVSPSFGETFLK
jgi:hypothetical protein